MLGGLVAIALLLAGSVAAVLLLERRPARAPPRVEAAEPPPPPRTAVAAVAPTAGRPAPPAAVAPPPPAPAPGTEREPAPPFDMAARKRALAPLRDEVLAALAALDARLVRCGRPAVNLVLSLETLERRVHVVDVQVKGPDPGELPEGVAPPPEETPETIACVRRALLDEMLPAPSARPGRRWEMAYVPGAR